MPDKKKKGKEKEGKEKEGKTENEESKESAEKSTQPENAALLEDKPKINGKSKRPLEGPSKSSPLIRAYSTESGPDLHKSQQNMDMLYTTSNHHKHEFLGTSCTLLPPAITYDEVTTAPNSPVFEPSGIMMHNLGLSASAQHLHHLDARSSSVTPSGSLLAVNRPYELRESTLTVNYPDSGGMFLHRFALLYVLG